MLSLSLLCKMQILWYVHIPPLSHAISLHEILLCSFSLTKGGPLHWEEKGSYASLFNKGKRLKNSLWCWLVWAIICCTVKESACQLWEMMSNLKNDCKLHLTDWQSNQPKLKESTLGMQSTFYHQVVQPQQVQQNGRLVCKRAQTWQ